MCKDTTHATKIKNLMNELELSILNQIFPEFTLYEYRSGSNLKWIQTDCQKSNLQWLYFILCSSPRLKYNVGELCKMTYTFASCYMIEATMIHLHPAKLFKPKLTKKCSLTITLFDLHLKSQTDKSIITLSLSLIIMIK